MRTLRLLALCCAGCLFGGKAAAIVVLPPCELRGVGYISFLPPHPQPIDDISFRSLANLSLDPGEVVMFKVDRTATNLVTLDMVTTTNPQLFPGYGRSDLPLVEGSLGKFAVGTYAVTVTTRSHDAAGGTFSPICQGIKTWSLQVFADSGQSPVVEFYNAKLDHYFMTQNPAEMHDLDSGVHAGWVRTGESFDTYVPGAAIYGSYGASKRYYGLPSAGLDSHFYTVFSTDVIGLTMGPHAKDWRLESENAFEVQAPDVTDGACFDSMPVYRVWNNRVDSNHRYMTKRTIRDGMVAAGWIAEGYGADAVAMCVPGKQR